MDASRAPLPNQTASLKGRSRQGRARQPTDEYPLADLVTTNSSLQGRKTEYTTPLESDDEHERQSERSVAMSDSRSTSSIDTQSQIINAFRNSYSTHLSGGAWDSSYSGLMSDPESPTDTMDFHHAMTSHTRSTVEAAQQSMGAAGTVTVNAAGVGSSPSVSHADHNAPERDRVKASSWDSLAAGGIHLHRIPSTSTARNDSFRRDPRANGVAEPKPGRDSAISATDPFHYLVSPGASQWCEADETRAS